MQEKIEVGDRLVFVGHNKVGQCIVNSVDSDKYEVTWLTAEGLTVIGSTQTVFASEIAKNIGDFGFFPNGKKWELTVFRPD